MKQAVKDVTAKQLGTEEIAFPSTTLGDALRWTRGMPIPMALEEADQLLLSARESLRMLERGSKDDSIVAALKGSIFLIDAGSALVSAAIRGMERNIAGDAYHIPTSFESEVQT